MRGSTAPMSASGSERLRRRLPRRRAGARRRLRPRRVPRPACAKPASRRAVSTATPTWSPSRAEGLDVEQEDASRTSRGSRTARSAAIFAAQVVEHCRRPRWCGCSSCGAKLRPGGMLVAETINPLALARAQELLRRPDARAAARPRDARCSPARPASREQTALPQRAAAGGAAAAGRTAAGRRLRRRPRGARRQRGAAERRPLRPARTTRRRARR